MKKLILIYLSLTLLVACQSKNNINDIQNSSSSVPTDTSPKPDESSIVPPPTTPVIESTPHYIAENDFTGEKVTLNSDILLKEQKNIFQAVVSVTEKRMSDTGVHNRTYVFVKDKKEGSQWKIHDID
ncbi:hypothetical protein [Paenibacillus assamensis]|uniref:hypothetical protein n=1 Tax=Paenibacillus assamensis TaxID=311244 RepID=UPI00048F11BD|nr:hypothetical protein [Paenibacillus assamensis]